MTWSERMDYCRTHAAGKWRNHHSFGEGIQSSGRSLALQVARAYYHRFCNVGDQSGQGQKSTMLATLKDTTYKPFQIFPNLLPRQSFSDLRSFQSSPRLGNCPLRSVAGTVWPSCFTTLIQCSEPQVSESQNFSDCLSQLSHFAFSFRAYQASPVEHVLHWIILDPYFVSSNQFFFLCLLSVQFLTCGNFLGD